MSIRTLAEFAVFVREHYLDEAAQENLRVAREMDFPLMRLFAHLEEEQLFQMSRAGLHEFFTLLEYGRQLQRAEESMRLWERDELPGLPRASVDISDLVYVYVAQKRTMMKFLPDFTADIREALAIVGEMEDYYALVQDMAFHTMIRIHGEELNRKNEELLRSNAELEQFAYVSSHDLQEPLRKIRAFGDRLAEKYRSSLGDDGAMYIDIMQNAASRMHVLINDLLKFSRLSKDRERFTRVDLATLVADSLSDLEISIEQTQADIAVGELPVIDGIPGQLRQLFLNLIGNALKFQRPGVPPKVSIRAETIQGRLIPGVSPVHSGNKFCRIFVEDNGIGFNEQYAEKIFIVFQRLHGKQEYQGTGIGLAVCKKIADNHRGFIVATSRENEGSTFIVTLPFRQNNNESNAKTGQENQNSHGG